jgi:uncharacterized protein
MNVVVAGASGFVGTALVPVLRERDITVKKLVRRAAQHADEIEWSPECGQVDERQLADIDAVINLAGENLAAGRWTARRRNRIFRSRVDATRTLVDALGRLSRRSVTLLNASAVGFYGERGDEELSEASAIGQGFLPEVCLAWETHAQAASRFDVRVVRLRFGVVLAADGGALAKMLPLFRLGLGGRLGRGHQWMSWISRTDAIRAILHALEHARCDGPINVVASEPVRNRDFTRTLAATLHRPALLPAPAAMLRLIFGRMADEALLASTRAIPARLLETGFAFHHATLETALRATLHSG